MSDVLIFATHNENKLREVRQMLEPLQISVLGGDECHMPDVEETGSSFEENALLKALAGVKATGKPVLAEDSGICIEALDGAPGIYAARFAQKHGGFPAVFDTINEQIGDNPNRNAHYVCVMILAYSETDYQVFKGYMYGTLAHHASGNGGFGYDPLFIPEGMETTLGHLDAAVKNKISHRYKALKQVYAFLKNKNK